MLGGVTGWRALLLLLSVSSLQAADDINAAALSLAKKTAALAHGEAVSASYRNISSLPPADWGGLRSAFESALRDAGSRVADNSPVEARLTVSETPAQYLIVEEARRGDDRQVWFASWNRATSGAPTKPAGISLQVTEIWRQPEQILDVAFFNQGMLVLTPTKLTLYAKANDAWTVRDSAAISSSRPWPRDLRGHLRTTGSTFQIYLPGLACNGNTAPSLSLDCRASEAPWVLESGNRGILLATLAASRNYFDGRVVTQTGARKTVAPFYSAASVESQGRTLWVMAQTDGRAQIADAALEPLGAIPQWGSDIAGIDAHCGGPSQVLATRTGDFTEPDALQSFTVGEHAATPVTAPALLPGPVTALWPAGPAAALAVSHDNISGDFIAYLASVACAN